MMSQNKLHNLMLGLIAVSMFAIAGCGQGTGAALAESDPADASRSGSQGGSCPSSNAIGNFTEAGNVGAVFTNSDGATTYWFRSLVDETDGTVPGLIAYCVYPDSEEGPSEIETVALGGNPPSYPWISRQQSPDHFSFVRPPLRKGGNSSNIPLDGTTTEMGTATWSDTAPDNQEILLHIADQSVCNSLYPGISSSTCFVKPSTEPLCGVGDPDLAYNSIPYDFGKGCIPPPSEAFEAQGVSEFGDGVEVAKGGSLQSLIVDFQSYGCGDSGRWHTGDCVTVSNQTFTFPDSGITASIYAMNSDGSVGSLLGQAMYDGPIPFRPSASASCTGTDLGKWYDPASGQCVNSLSVPITFTGFDPPITLEAGDQVIWAVAFNTTHYGYTPIGEGTECFIAGNPGCGWDSLNVGTKTYAGAPYSGSDVNPSGVYLSDGQPASALHLNDDPDMDWELYLPLAQIVTSGP